MVRIDNRDGALVLDVSQHTQLLSGRYSLVLTEMGFVKDFRSQCYILKDSTRVRSEINDIIFYLEGKGFEVEATSQIELLQTNIAEESELFEKAKECGAIVKSQNTEVSLVIPGFQRKLKNYQEKAIRHMLAVENGANFSVPGSGKTTMIYAAYSVWKEKGEVDKLLVIGPPSSFMAWEDEFIECLGKEPVSYRLIGPERNQRYKLASRADIFLTTFQTATLDEANIIDIMTKYKVMMVIDESHYIKRFENGIWANTVLRLAPYAKHRAICTGTPMPNDLLDLYTQLTFLWPGKHLLGEQQWFKNEVKRAQRFEDIQAKIYPFFYRIKKADLHLPEPTIHIRRVPMSKLQQQIYNVLAARTIEEIVQLTSREISELRHWRRAKMVRLMQTASNPSLLADYSDEFQVPPLVVGNQSIIDLIENYSKYEMPNKLVEVVELVKKLIAEGEKVLVWSTFIKNIEIIIRLLQQDQIPIFMIFGAVPKDDEANEDFNREQQIRGFKQSNSPCVLVANPAACAESISLHRDCHHAVYLDRSFNCGHYLQSMDRIHRIGLTLDQETHYYLFESENSIDEVIHQRLEEKSQLMYRMLEADFPLGSLDLDTDGWNNNEELEDDFNAVEAHIRYSTQVR